jgi:hypothetical protein
MLNRLVMRPRVQWEQARSPVLNNRLLDASLELQRDVLAHFHADIVNLIAIL